MPPGLSINLRRDIEGYIRRGDSSQVIHDHTYVSVRQINRMRKNLKLHDDVVAPKAPVQGRPRTLSPLVENALLEYLEQRPTAYRDEMCWFLWDEFEIQVAERTMSDILKRLGWTHKKVSAESTSLSPIQLFTM